MTPRGTQGYDIEADRLVVQYESITFEVGHAATLHLYPPPPATVLDIGAGTGRDAAHFAGLGHDVVALEPTQALREAGQRLHPSSRLTWLDDALPELSKLMASARSFDLVLLTAVWMHLDAAERTAAMPRLAGLLTNSGRLIISLRHGPVPAGRVMYDVSGAETVKLARTAGLAAIHHSTEADMLARPDVRWTMLVFERA